MLDVLFQIFYSKYSIPHIRLARQRRSQSELACEGGGEMLRFVQEAFSAERKYCKMKMLDDEESLPSKCQKSNAANLILKV